MITAPLSGARPHLHVVLLSALAAGAASAQPLPDAAADITLPPAVVTATRFDDDPAALPFGISVVTAEEIRNAGVATVNEALMRLLGVPGRADLNGGGDYSLDLRGFGATADSNQVIVVDGLRISEADLGGTRLAGIPIETVERIEVLRGGGAVLYGEGATGGVIVVTTKARRGASRSSRGNVYAAAGSYGLRELRADATLASGGFSLDAAAARRDANNHRDNFRSRTDAASLAAQWRTESLRFGLRHADDRLDSGLPGALTAAQYAADPRQASTPNDHGNIRNRRSGVFGEAAVGGWRLAFDAGLRNKTLRSTFGGFAYDYDVTARDQSLRARHVSHDGEASNALTVGFDHNHWTRDVLGAFGSAASQSSRAVYLSDDLTLSSGTRLSAGVRSESFDKQTSAAASGLDSRQRAWQLGLVQPIGSGAAAYARWGRSYRLANVDEFSYTAPGAVLRPQSSRDAELGLRWMPPGGRAELRYYRSALTDEIGFDPATVGPFGPGGANVNFDPTRRQGVELEVVQAVDAQLRLRLNAALRQSRFTAGPYAGNEVPLTSRRTVALRFDWSSAAGHRIDAGITALSSQHPDFANACTIPGRSVVDLRYAYRIANAEFALGVANLADRRYYTQAFGCVAGVTTSIYPEAGRAFTGSARFTF